MGQRCRRRPALRARRTWCAWWSWWFRSPHVCAVLWPTGPDSSGSTQVRRRAGNRGTERGVRWQGALASACGGLRWRKALRFSALREGDLAVPACALDARARDVFAGRTTGYRRSSIWIGPSRRPWVNWSTTGLPLSISFARRAFPDDAALVDHRDAVADAARAGHVVGDRHRRAAQPLHAIDDQPVDHRAHDRVQPGGRLVEEHDVRLRRHRARQRHALLHAARKLGRPQLADRRARGPPAPAPPRPARAPRAVGALRCASRPKATFSQTGRLSNSAPFWNSMPMRARTRLGLAAVACASTFCAVDLDDAGVRLQQPEHAFQQHRLAGAGAADHHHRGAGRHVEIDAVQHHLVAEGLAQAADADLGTAGASLIGRRTVRSARSRRPG